MDITHLIEHPEELNQETLYDLRRLVAVYPTYHAARILFLQNLFLLHDSTFDQELRKASLLVPDRRVLFAMTQTFTQRTKTTAQPNGAAAVNTTTQANPLVASVTEARTESTEPVVAIGEAPETIADKPTEVGAANAELAHVSAEEAAASAEEAHVSAEVPAADGEAPAEISAMDDTPAPAAGTATAQAVAPAGKTRRPTKKYAPADSTSRLLDDFLSNTPAPLPKKSIKADPSTDYMSFLMQQENENPTEELAANAETPATDATASRLDTLIDSFIASQAEGITLSDNPITPEGIFDTESEGGTDSVEAEAETDIYSEDGVTAENETATSTATASAEEGEATPPAAAENETAAAVAEPLTDKASDAEPSIPSGTSAPAEDAAAESAEPLSSKETSGTSAELSETLAQIYIKQQKYDRAIEVLSKISAEGASNANPFLADQMRFLQKLARLQQTRKK